MSFWDLDAAERETFLFVKRACRSRAASAVWWEELSADIERDIALFARRAQSYQAWRHPPLFTHEQGQLAFMEALRRLRTKGFIWEKPVIDSTGISVLYKPLA